MTMVLLVIGILLAVIGLVNMNLILLVAGGILCLASGFYALRHWQTKKQEARRIRELTEGMDRYFTSHPSLQISEHVSIQRPGKDYQDFRDLVVYYDGQYVSPLSAFASTPSFEATYYTLEEKLMAYCLDGDFVDENHNGIDDRQEEKRAPYYRQMLEQEMHRFEQPEIQASLRSISARLGQIHELETRYEGVSAHLRKLYQHYLPMMLSILEQYHTLEAKGASAAELAQMEMKLSKTLVLVEEALKTMIASLVQDDVLNIKSDMSVLEAILKRDGLVKEGTLESVGERHE